MSELANPQLITVNKALEMLKDRNEQRNKRFPHLQTPGKYILPNYRLTRKRMAFKIRRHAFLQKHNKSYVAFDSANGQTLWSQNFPNITEAMFWLDTGLKPSDTDSTSSFKQWKEKHIEEIENLKQEAKEIVSANKENKKVKVKKKKPVNKKAK